MLEHEKLCDYAQL
jgi:hypothetical protein